MRELAWVRAWQEFLRAHPEITVAHTGGFEFEAEVVVRFERPLAFDDSSLAVVQERGDPLLELLYSVRVPDGSETSDRAGR